MCGHAVNPRRSPAGFDVCPLLCPCSPSSAPQEAKFIILEQAFLEALQRRDSAAALACLREQLAPLGVHPERLHRLASRLMGGSDGGGELLAATAADGSSSDSESGGGDAATDGAAALAASRPAVLRRLQVRAAAPPSVGSAARARLARAWPRRRR